VMDQSQRWKYHALSPLKWLESADVLRACAERIGAAFVEDILTPHPPVERTTEDVPPLMFGPTFQMLAGYSIEALLKGILIIRQPIPATADKLPRWLTTHDLEGLLNRVSVTLDDPLLDFVHRAHVAVVWSGRYPAPKSAANMGFKLSSSADLDFFRDIYERLAVLLQGELRRADSTNKEMDRDERRRLCP